MYKNQTVAVVVPAYNEEKTNQYGNRNHARFCR
jgi:hypothetical protein